MGRNITGIIPALVFGVRDLEMETRPKYNNPGIKIRQNRFTEDKLHECPHEGCDAVFVRPFKLKAHLNVHKGKRPFRCGVEGCDKAYTTKYHLQRHLKSHKQPSYTETFKCSQEGCEMEFTLLHNLRKHIHRKHEKEYPYNCSECKKGFRKPGQLKTHEFQHTGVSPYRCDFCRLGFTTGYQLRRHLRGHIERVCEECGRSFNSGLELRKHYASKHPLRYFCDNCGKEFLNKALLAAHVAVYLEKREAFSCPHESCSRYYYEKKNLDYHVRTYHEGQKFKVFCGQCDAELSNKQKLKDHLKSVHGKDVAEKVKKERKRRKDAGIPRLPLAGRLSGLGVSSDLSQSLLNQKDVTLDLTPLTSSTAQILAKKTPVVLLKRLDECLEEGEVQGRSGDSRELLAVSSCKKRTRISPSPNKENLLLKDKPHMDQTESAYRRGLIRKCLVVVENMNCSPASDSQLNSGPKSDEANLSCSSSLRLGCERLQGVDTISEEKVVELNNITDQKFVSSFKPRKVKMANLTLSKVCKRSTHQKLRKTRSKITSLLSNRNSSEADSLTTSFAKFSLECLAGKTHNIKLQDLENVTRTEDCDELRTIHANVQSMEVANKDQHKCVSQEPSSSKLCSAVSKCSNGNVIPGQLERSNECVTSSSQSSGDVGGLKVSAFPQAAPIQNSPSLIGLNIISPSESLSDGDKPVALSTDHTNGEELKDSRCHSSKNVVTTADSLSHVEKPIAFISDQTNREELCHSSKNVTAVESLLHAEKQVALNTDLRDREELKGSTGHSTKNDVNTVKSLSHVEKPVSLNIDNTNRQELCQSSKNVVSTAESLLCAEKPVALIANNTNRQELGISSQNFVITAESLSNAKKPVALITDCTIREELGHSRKNVTTADSLSHAEKTVALNTDHTNREELNSSLDHSNKHFVTTPESPSRAEKPLVLIANNTHKEELGHSSKYVVSTAESLSQTEKLVAPIADNISKEDYSHSPSHTSSNGESLIKCKSHAEKPVAPSSDNMSNKEDGRSQSHSRLNVITADNLTILPSLQAGRPMTGNSCHSRYNVISPAGKQSHTEKPNKSKELYKSSNHDSKNVASAEISKLSAVFPIMETAAPIGSDVTLGDDSGSPFHTGINKHSCTVDPLAQVSCNTSSLVSDIHGSESHKEVPECIKEEDYQELQVGRCDINPTTSDSVSDSNNLTSKSQTSDTDGDSVVELFDDDEEEEERSSMDIPMWLSFMQYAMCATIPEIRRQD